MRILVYGAGVLGGSLAHDLYQGGKDVTILARGNWAKEIQQNGLAVKGIVRTKVDQIKVITELRPEDKYDVIFVVMQFSQIDSVLPILTENTSHTIVFVGNNMKAAEYRKLLPDKTVLFGSYSTAGKREEKRLKSISLHKITVGPANGKGFPEQLAPVFAGMKFKVVEMDDMDGWLKTHAAFILPFAYATYYTDGNLKKVRHDQVFLDKMIDAMEEGYRVIKAAGYKIVPPSEYDYVTVQRKKCMMFCKLMTGTKLGKIAVVDHSMAARNEMQILSNCFDELKEKSGLITPALDELKKLAGM